MFLLWLAISLAAPAETKSSGSPEPSTLFEKLIGDWDVSGKTQGQPIHQKLRVTKTLADTFVELHFMGTEPPDNGMPPYEARIFLGWNKKKKLLVSHWLDVFGAAGSCIGEGRMKSAHSFELIFKYPDAWFRNTYSWDESGESWRLLIESRKKDGAWTTFADQRLVKGTKQDHY